MRTTTSLLLLIILLATVPHRALAAETCLPNQPAEVACLDDTFTSFWQTNGGLAVFGYALAGAAPERNADAPQEFVTQWTERTRFELHPENSAPYTILLGRMGADRLAQLGRDPAAEGRESGPLAGCLWFEATGHNVCDQASGQGFKSYWESHGLTIAGMDDYRRSLALFGLPLTAAREEQGANGQAVLTQWFERARFEWRPDNPSEYRVQLGLLGAEVRAGRSRPAGPSIFGVTISSGFVGATAGRASAARASWVRYGDFLWSEIEPAPGAREWSRLAGIEEEAKILAAQGLTTIGVVRSAPSWAQQIAGNTCAAIKPEALDAFAGFMRDLVARYSAAPYNIKYWEIWNEEDIDPSQIGVSSGFGCWGDKNDPYFGGGAYAELLKRAYPAIKQANPNAQVLMGGLLLDCDADHPIEGRNCAESRFFEGLLRNGGGEAFDIVSYHGYAFWTGKNEDWERNNPAWQPRGGVVLGKLQLLRETMARYSVDKPVLLTEAGLLCYRSSPQCGPRFFSAQASYLTRVYARAWANGLLGAIWYTLEGPGWEKGGLLDENQQPRPAYQALSFMTGLLGGASYAGPRSNGTIEGYAFTKGAKRYEIFWTNDDTPARMAWPAGAVAAYDGYGQPLPVAGPDLEVNFNPIVIEIGP